MSPGAAAERIVAAVKALPDGDARQLVAIAGPPGAGKSTIAAKTRTALVRAGIPAGLVAMDGFHLSNSILEARGLRDKKGAPQTFDLAGFDHLLARLRTEAEVIAPTFDRSLDAAIGSSEVISPDQRVVVVEGNYLLLDEPGWRDLSGKWALTVYLDIDADTLEARLVDRWLSHGMTPEDARAWTASNDLPNALRVTENRLPANLVLTT